MPAGSEAAFEDFFNHAIRLRWDTLVNVSYVEGGGTHPYVGAITSNLGSGWKKALGLSMRTRYLTDDPPRRASAVLVEPTGLFSKWGASISFVDRPDGDCDLNYTFTIHLRPRWLGWMLDPIAGFLFALETRRRFGAMSRYLKRIEVNEGKR